MEDTKKCEQLCRIYTSLCDEDIQIILEKSRMLQTIADISQANVFIDCRVKEAETVIVVAEAVPTTIHSLYEGKVVGELIHEVYEPAVFRAYRTGEPTLVNRAVTHEGRHVSQNVVPIKNKLDLTIGMLVLEKDITIQVNHEKELAILSETTEEISRKFWDLVTTNGAIPDVIEEALIIVNEEGNVLYANNFAIRLIDARNYVTTQNILNKPIEEVFPFIERTDYLHHGPTQREVYDKEMVYILRCVSLKDKGEKKKILLYLRDITDLRDKERQLMVKSAVIKEIHHRVKNNLQTVASLLRLQMRRGVPTEAKVLYQESLNRIVSIATVHEVLSYSGIEQVNMKQVIEKISRLISYNAIHDEQNIQVCLQVNDIKLSSNQAVSLALVLTELIQNSLKHAFVNSLIGTITIQFYCKNEWVYLIVEDDGVGMQGQVSENQLGLEIVKTLTQYDLDGSFEFVKAEDKGAKALITFPVRQED